MKAARIVLVVLGVLVVAFGAYVLVTSVKPNRIGGLATWLLGAVILHDAILSPFVVGAGLLLRRAGRSLQAWVLVVVQTVIVLGSVLALVVLPEIAAKRHGQKNPTILPFDYGTRLLIVEGVLLLVVVAVLVVGVVRARQSAVRGARDTG
ncbi:hypothetical protein KK101_15240 [Curtobacterium flaccumfaciens pv. oortii]|uniref:hypothetical protein n=1 Tax=Curtobacterium flaccumfaciens TaxID=2035 RepID=UPI001BDE565C|nr:hypothetical protein [Curtobacterium flaccumfaciens]MBT1624048.1 hypothetical protein [Curtobacterium flaccumfaciens pv. oortii]